MPLSAVAPVPSTTALQPGPVSVEWMPVMVPAVTPVVELNDTAFRLQGKWLFVTVNIRPPGPVQLVNASDVIEPMPVPDSPLPLLSVAAPFEDAQDSETPLRVSVRVAFPDVAVVGPPGLTVQVAATAGAALRPITPAIAAPRKRTLPVRLRIAMGPISLIDLPIIQWRSGCWCLIRPRPTRAIHAGSLRPTPSAAAAMSASIHYLGVISAIRPSSSRPSMARAYMPRNPMSFVLTRAVGQAMARPRSRLFMVRGSISGADAPSVTALCQKPPGLNMRLA